MEIKNVKENSKKTYPTIEEIDTKILKKNMPNKWLKTGMTMTIFTLLTKKSSFANSLDRDEMVHTILPGDIPKPSEPVFQPNALVISIFMIILSIVIGVKSKLKKKKGILESRKMKFTRISLLIITILVSIQAAIYLNDYYGWI